MGSQVDRSRAAIDLLHVGGAVAAGRIGLTVELLAAGAGAQRVALLGAGVTELAKLKYSVSTLSSYSSSVGFVRVKTHVLSSSARKTLDVVTNAITGTP